ncbi:MAG: filamentous hemagglutinin N-terminal domain-containing protein, partial [Myxococcota bacterium]|nr:filamentous hemagglutinin N-terminal domain-containing protein [Myxococcota bacterium]
MRSRFVAGLCLALGTLSPDAQAQNATPSADWNSLTTRIETDGSLGAAQTLSPDSFDVYTVGEDLGKRAGGNLFHSFLYFDLGAGDTALFTADPSVTTENIVSRVTGGEPSHVNGTLKSNVTGANFYFLNPDGVLFGPDAKLDIPASFHASTAEDLGFEDDIRFSTRWSAGDSSGLSMASPADFGFLGDSSQRIVFDGSAVLSGDIDGGLRVHAGGVDLRRGAVLVTKNHGVEIVATDSITLSGKDESDGRGSEIAVINSFAGQQQPPAGGSILLEADSVRLNDGAAIAILNNNGAMTEGGSLTIRATDRIVLDGTDGQEVEPLSGGDLQLGSVDLFTRTVGGGDGVGRITLEAPHVSILDGADVTTFRFAGNGSRVGDIEIRADQQLELAGIGGDGHGSRVRSANLDSLAGSAPGSVRVEAGTLLLRDGGTLASNTAGSAAGGDVSVIATHLVSIAGQDTSGGTTGAPQPSTLQAAQTDGLGGGAGGSVTVEAPQIELANGGQILALSDGTGDAGSVILTATDEVRLSGGGVVSVEANAADGGDLTIQGGALVSLDDSRLEASVQGGVGGSILIGDSGAASEALILAGKSSIKANADAPGGQGGRVEINAQVVLSSLDSQINASAPGGPEAQGQVIFNAPETSIESQVVPPNASYLDASSLLRAQCGNEAAGGRFTLTRWPDASLSTEGPLLALSFSDFGANALASAQAAPPDDSLPASLLALRGGKTPSEGARASFESLAPLEGQLSEAQISGDRASEARALAALANGYAALGEYREAEPLLGEAVEITRGSMAVASESATTAPVTLRAALLNSRGHVRAMAGNASGALADYGASARDAGAEGDLLLAAQAQANAARTALVLGKQAEARAELARARRTLEQSGARPAEQIEVRIHVAETETALAQQNPTTRAQALVAAHADLIRASEVAEAEGDPRAASHALGSLGTLYSQETGRDREARYLTRRALQLAEEAQAADLLARWYAQLGRFDWNSGRTRSALDAYRRAVDVLGQTRPEARAAYGSADIVFRRSVEPIYLALVDLLLQSSSEALTRESEQALLGEARRVVERSKAAELRNYFRDSCAAELAATARAVETLDPGAAVIYPIVLPDRIELLVSRASGISRATVPVSEAALRREAKRFRSLVTKRVTRQYETHAQQLHTWLVDPYLPILEEESIRTLVFVPTGVLRTIPMAALHDGQSFLIERYAVA